MNFLIKMKDGLVIKCIFCKLVEGENKVELGSGLFFAENRLVPCGEFETLILKLDEIAETTVLK